MSIAVKKTRLIYWFVQYDAPPNTDSLERPDRWGGPSTSTYRHDLCIRSRSRSRSTSRQRPDSSSRNVYRDTTESRAHIVNNDVVGDEWEQSAPSSSSSFLSPPLDRRGSMLEERSHSPTRSPLALEQLPESLRLRTPSPTTLMPHDKKGKGRADLASHASSEDDDNSPPAVSEKFDLKIKGLGEPTVSNETSSQQLNSVSTDSKCRQPPPKRKIWDVLASVKAHIESSKVDLPQHKTNIALAQETTSVQVDSNDVVDFPEFWKRPIGLSSQHHDTKEISIRGQSSRANDEPEHGKPLSAILAHRLLHERRSSNSEQTVDSGGVTEEEFDKTDFERADQLTKRAKLRFRLKAARDEALANKTQIDEGNAGF